MDNEPWQRGLVLVMQNVTIHVFFFFFLTRAPDAIERTSGGSKIFLKRGQGLHHYKMTSTSSHVSFNLECYLILDFG